MVIALEVKGEDLSFLRERSDQRMLCLQRFVLRGFWASVEERRRSHSQDPGEVKLATNFGRSFH
jgi:hypothetical protein